MANCRQKIGSSICKKTPKYLLDAYEKLEKNKSIHFTYRNVNYALNSTKFDKIALLSKGEGKTKIKYQYTAIIGPPSHMSSIKFKSTKDGSAVVGSSDKGTQNIAKYNYMVKYMDGIVQIMKGEKIWLDKNGKIIIGWHGSYKPPTSM